MIDLMHHIKRPYMPLPYDMVEAIGLDGSGVDRAARFPYTWSNLTDCERDQLLDRFPPQIVVATFVSGDATFIATGWTEAGARTRIERAYAADRAEFSRCCGISPDSLADYPVADETGVLPGPVGSTWRDGSFYPKGDN